MLKTNLNDSKCLTQTASIQCCHWLYSLTNHAVPPIFFKRSLALNSFKQDRVAPLVKYPPCAEATLFQNHLFANPLLYIATTFEPMLQFIYFFFRMYKGGIIISMFQPPSFNHLSMGAFQRFLRNIIIQLISSITVRLVEHLVLKKVIVSVNVVNEVNQPSVRLADC